MKLCLLIVRLQLDARSFTRIKRLLLVRYRVLIISFTNVCKGFCQKRVTKCYLYGKKVWSNSEVVIVVFRAGKKLPGSVAAVLPLLTLV